MPVNDGQKEFIQHSIEHLLDFSTNTADLQKQVQQLQNITQIDIDPSHPFFDLHYCLHHPEERLMGLEKYQTDSTVKEVKLAILDVINDALKKAANHAQLDVIFLNKGL